uniref:Aminoacyl-tRNA synthetase class II (G/ P/ S/T) domain-containing protein n=1 Tax=Panagrolaimus sp. JU765 TaxID=591449 RepID=A0AC34R7T2_9BILA
MPFYPFISICSRSTCSRIFTRFSSVNFAQGCCQVQKPKKMTTLADERPDLDFDYLLDESNIEKIQNNIQNRKGIGNILKVHELWKKIQEFEPSKPEQSQKGVEEYQKLWDQFYEEALMIPNQTDEEVPVGDESKAKTVDNAPFTPSEKLEKYKTAEEIVKGWNSILYPRRSAGGKSYVLLGPTANLQNALFEYAKDNILNHSKLCFQEVQVLDILPKVVTQACGLNINQDENSHPIQYTITDFPKLCLSGTAEMGIAQKFEGSIFKETELPLLLVAESRCYRPEVSKSAIEAKLYRVHEFNKLEMFAICHPNQSSSILKQFVEIQKSLWDQLG